MRMKQAASPLLAHVPHSVNKDPIQLLIGQNKQSLPGVKAGKV